MLTSVINVHDEFRKVIGATITVTDNTPVDVPVRFARQSKEDWAEVAFESYPQVTILDYLPDFDPTWYQTYQKRIAGYNTPVSVTNNQMTKAFEVQDPIRFIFRYDVSVYCKNAYQKWLLNEYFLKTFSKQGSFMFNKTATVAEGGESIGDMVYYAVNPAEVLRTDGVFETNYEFTLKPMIAIQDAVDVDLVQQLLINGQ